MSSGKPAELLAALLGSPSSITKKEDKNILPECAHKNNWIWLDTHTEKKKAKETFVGCNNAIKFK